MQLVLWVRPMKISLEEAVTVIIEAHYEIYGTNIESILELEVRRILMARYCAHEEHSTTRMGKKSLLQG